MLSYTVFVRLRRLSGCALSIGNGYTQARAQLFYIGILKHIPNSKRCLQQRLAVRRGQRCRRQWLDRRFATHAVSTHTHAPTLLDVRTPSRTATWKIQRLTSNTDREL